MKIVCKISVQLQASIQPFIWARVAGPTSYLSDNFEVPKCWTSEVPHPSCPISNFPTIQTVDIFFHLSAITAKPVFWYLQIFSLVYYDWILSIGQHVNIGDLGVRLRLLTFCIIFPTFLRTGISPDFTWIFIDWVSAGFFPGVFLLGIRKKDSGKKLSQKSESIYSFKNKCNFCNHDNSFRKIKWFV